MQIEMHKSALIRIANLSVFLFVMLLFFVFEREELLINMLSDIDNYGSSLLNISLFALTLTLSACSLYGRWSGNKLFLCFMLLTMYVATVTTIIGPPKIESVSSYIALVAGTTLPFLLCHFMYNATLRLSSKTILITIGIFIFLLGCIYTLSFLKIIRHILLENYRGGGPYLFLMLLPFVMLFSQKIIKMIFIVLIMLCIVSSMKRGAILAGLLSITVYYIVGTLQSKNSIPINKIIRLSAAIALIVIFFITFDAFTGGTIIERFANISEDGGSKRDIVYEVVIMMIINSDFIEILFGHGWNSVVYYSPLNLSAHNDYLEIFYDCGLLAFLLFCSLIVIIFHKTKELIQRKSPLSPAFAASCVIIVINTMVSHVFLYTWYISAIALFWGYCIGIDRKAAMDAESRELDSMNFKAADK